MEYISHEDYKKMLTSFGKEVPKAKLNEGLEKEGNAFTAGLAKAKKGQEFKVGNKEFTDRTNYDASISEEEEDLLEPEILGKKIAQMHPELNTHGSDAFNVDEFRNGVIAAIEELMPGEDVDHLVQAGVSGKGGEDWILDVYDAIRKAFQMKEGNAFTAGLAKTKKGGEFKVGGKEFKDRTNYDASVSEEYDSPYDGGADDLAAMAKDDISKDTNGIDYHIGDKVNYQGHSFTIMIGAGGTVVLKHSSGRIVPTQQSMEILKQAAIDKKFGSVDEYQFDQMYPDDPGPFEGIEQKLKEFLAKEDDVNWDRMDDEEAEENETDNGIEEKSFSPDSSDFEQEVASQLNYIGNEELTDEEHAKALKALEDPKVVNALWSMEPNKAAAALVKMVKGGESEMEEDINLPSSQPTGPSIEEKRSRLAHLTSEERDQLKQYIETIKTVKEEIKKMVGKNDMDESGDNTNLIMQPTTVSEEGGGEHEEIESNLDPKIHDAFHKVTGMAVKSLIKAGISPDQIKAFFQHEISELPDFVTRQYEE